ncbi:Torsin-1A-interacting protein 1 [Holothuria leucospilota]|uniref:Torsin-1A-interacting protein 1 n=1 Tax=Holothuria leucospilota TaxID=206669 RepID=A0A9Q1H450_HOLLE|nr:Torsin-1A-interacting protein 1 [Holothuria leucospilota]
MRLDCAASCEIIKASIYKTFSQGGYNFGLNTASTNTGFCNPHKNKSCDKFLLQKIEHLALKYNDQSSYTWLTLFAAAHDHVSYQPDPQRPIVIMVYRLKNGSRVTEILEDIAEVYDSVLPPWKNYGNITIDGKSFTNSSPEETQKQIQDMLENGFEKEAQKVAVVYDFDKLPSCSVLTFHNYCNNEDAPHKNVAIILTVTGTDENLPSNPKSPDLEEAVSKSFHEKWKDCPEELPPGKIDAMLSRVANNVILLR